MKNPLAVIVLLSLPLVRLDLIESTFAQEKTTHIAIRLDTLRGISDSLARTRVAASIDSAKVGKNWQRLKQGLTDQAVGDLLGRPTKIEYDMTNGFIYWWYGKRSVIFRSFTHKLIEWDP